MTFWQLDAPRRAGQICAKISHITGSIGVKGWQCLTDFWWDPRQSLPRLTDRQARDIGLDSADMEWSRLRLPSQTTHHPML